jgi:hypothetical protein
LRGKQPGPHTGGENDLVTLDPAGVGAHGRGAGAGLLEAQHAGVLPHLRPELPQPLRQRTGQRVGLDLPVVWEEQGVARPL